MAAGSVSLAGAVDGDVEITAGTIEILPNARINGNLTYTSPDAAEIDPGARIQGKVIVLGLVSTIPIVGWMIAWLAVVIGLGAASQEVFRRWAGGAILT